MKLSLPSYPMCPNFLTTIHEQGHLRVPKGGVRACSTRNQFTFSYLPYAVPGETEVKREITCHVYTSYHAINLLIVVIMDTEQSSKDMVGACSIVHVSIILIDETSLDLIGCTHAFLCTAHDTPTLIK